MRMYVFSWLRRRRRVRRVLPINHTSCISSIPRRYPIPYLLPRLDQTRSLSTDKYRIWLCTDSRSSWSSLVNREFHDLREEYNRRCMSQPAATTASLVDDFEIASFYIAEELPDAIGQDYADAADRCLRFLFLHQPRTSPFEDKRFRSAFFGDVVAPIQAAFELMPGSAADVI